VAGLLVQAAKADPNLVLVASRESGNRLLKAILMNSAKKLPYWHKGRLTTEDDHESPLDFVQGAGMIDAVASYRLLQAGRATPGDVGIAGWDLNAVDIERRYQHVYRLTVEEPEGQMLAATLTWFFLVNRVGAVRAATFHFLNPVFGVAIAAVLLGERLGPLDMIGVAVVTAGILAVQVSRGRASADTEPR
jgi:hypothetical protein